MESRRSFLCAGSFAKYYEEKGGDVLYHGKPHRPIYDMAWSLLGKPDKSRIIAVGDSLHTDIQGANGFGIASLFNLVGIHQDEVRVSSENSETDMAKLTNMLNSQPHKPTAVLGGLKW